MKPIGIDHSDLTIIGLTEYSKNPCSTCDNIIKQGVLRII